MNSRIDGSIQNSDGCQPRLAAATVFPPELPGTGTGMETVTGYRFVPEHLRVADRRPGISAFMRIRNGEDFLEVTIRSHLRFFDEIVAVYNQCTDQTASILQRLQQEFGPEKLRVIHYLDQVHPPGSQAHATTSPDSPNSLVNYYNFALASTRYQYATKLDDDHLAIPETTAAVTDMIRSGRAAENAMYCFSGLNVMRARDGRLAVPESDPVSGSGDIGIFRVTSETLFAHDRRFERFIRGSARRQFCGFLYWHLKYLKKDMGFGNYELNRNPGSRYAKRHAALQDGSIRLIDLPELRQSMRSGGLNRFLGWFSDKKALMSVRNTAIPEMFPDALLSDAISRTVSPEFRPAVLRPAA
ncbi:MAG: glycosyltransferase family 2 protein [Planctomyces sp.]|nr:glycosyltransferase family 2 protein [Planctomyces sp.]